MERALFLTGAFNRSMYFILREKKNFTISGRLESSRGLFSLLAGGWWLFLLRKDPGNVEFAIAGAILDARSGASDKMSGRGRGQREKNRLPEKPLSCESQILTSSAGGPGILIGPFTVNHRQFGVTQIRSMQISNRASVRFFLKLKDRNVVLKPEYTVGPNHPPNGSFRLILLLFHISFPNLAKNLGLSPNLF